MANQKFFVFSLDDSKTLGTVWAKYLNASERSYCVLSENGMVVTAHVGIREILRVEISKKLVSQHKIPKSSIFKGWHFANGSSELINP